MSIKNELTSAMAIKGYNQTSLAKDVGVTHATINSFINGKGNISTKVAKKICNVLDLSEEKRVAIFLPSISIKL
ncbi:MAG: helix-turn-helix transcriptional regulator [Clostridia bacterium]